MREPVGMRRNIAIRRATAYVSMWGGWFGSLGLGVWATVQYNPAKGSFAPQWVGFAFIFLVGLAIAGGSHVSRLKLSETIVDAFKAGVQVVHSVNIDEDEDDN